MAVEKSSPQVQTRAPSWARRQRFVREGPQGRMLIFALGLGIAAFLIAAFALAYLFLFHFGTESVHNRSWSQDFLVFLCISLAIFAIVTFAAALIYTHRIAGGLPRLQRAARQAGSGDLTANLRLREKDELHDLSDALQGMLDGFASLAHTDRATGQTIAEELRTVIQQIEHGDAGKEALVDRLRVLEAQAAAIARHYKLAKEDALRERL